MDYASNIKGNTSRLGIENITNTNYLILGDACEVVLKEGK